MSVLTYPQLTANKIPLEITDEAIGFLRSSSIDESDADTLRERLAEDGYLYLPGVLNTEVAADARRVLIERLADQQFLDPNAAIDDAVIRPGINVAFLPELALNNEPLSKLLYTGTMMEIFEGLFGEPVLHYDFTWIRAASKGMNASPHCDIVYMGRGTFDVGTAWTPLGDIPLDYGVLLMLEGSHKKRQELQDYLSRDVDTYCTNGPKAAKIESGEETWEWDGVLDYDAADLRRNLGGRWLTAHFKLGDVLIFSMGTVHCSADNQSNKIRLSSDSRYQRASEPADGRWIGPNPIGHSFAGKRGRIC
jgi:hypothetical protein